MPVKVKENSGLKIIEVFYSGITTSKDMKEATSQSITTMSETGINKILIDMRGIKLDTSLMDIHDMPDKQYEQEGLDSDSRIAMIYAGTAIENELIDYFASVSRNRGWKVSTFSEHSDAIKWLSLAS